MNSAKAAEAASSKAAEAQMEKQKHTQDEAAPSYAPTTSSDIPSEAYPMIDSGSQAGPSPRQAPAQTPTGVVTGTGIPTVENPFNFPQAEELPAYTPQQQRLDSTTAAAAAVGGSAAPPEAASTYLRPIAIPQAHPNASAAFLDAYPECLLARGVTEETWLSFMKTLSAFLTAKISNKAISHLGDIGKSLGEGPKQFGKDIGSQAKSIGKGIASHAKRGNIFGVATTALVGVVTIPIFAAIGVAGQAVQLPGNTIAAFSKKPRSAAQRAIAYVNIANEKWLHARGLHAHLADTRDLAEMLGMPLEQLLGVARGGKQESAVGQLKALEIHLEPLTLKENTSLDLLENTVWLVVAQEIRQETHNETTNPAIPQE